MTFPALAAPLDDAAFLDGLRQRRLFDLAAAACRQQLAAPGVSKAAQARLITELILTHAQQARHAPADLRDKHWQQARAAAEEFARTQPQHPHLALVRLQDALTVLDQGELARLEAEVSPTPDAALARARDTLREAARLLEQLDKQLTRDIPLRNRQPARPDEPTGDDLVALQQNVLHQWARTFRQQGLCYAPQSDDRLAALGQALPLLKRMLTQLSADDPLLWQVRLDQIIAVRLLGRLPEAATLLEEFAQGRPPANLTWMARAEAMRLQVDAGRPALALELADGAPDAAGKSAEFDLARLEAVVALWRSADRAKNAGESAARQKQAVDLVRFLDQAHGPFWARRGEQLLVGAAASGAGGTNLDILRRAADDLYLKSEFDQAIAAYEKAAETARAAGETNAAFDLRYKAALVQQKRRLHGDAARRLRDASLAAASHPKAESAHLAAAWNLAQEAAREPAALDAYRDVLREHVAQWPAAPGTGQARVWLGRLHESRREWSEALAAYQEVAADSDQFDAAVEAAVRCWPRRLEESNDATLAESAARYFEGLVLGANNQWPERWSPAQKRAALAAAEIRLRFQPGTFRRAETMLTAALQGTTTQADAADDEWRQAVQAWQIVALAGQSRLADAQAAVARLGEGAAKNGTDTPASSAARLLAVQHRLSTIAERAAPAVKAELAQLQLSTLALLRQRERDLPTADRVALQRLEASALASAGRRAEALRAYEALARQLPDDAAVQASFAEHLLQATDRSTLERALDQWRRVAGRTPPNTPAWFRAKYSIALAQFKLGDKAGAAQLLRYMQTTTDLRSTGVQRDVEELLKKCS